MPPTADGDEPRRLSVGGESRFVDASSSTAWTGATEAGPRADDDVADLAEPLQAEVPLHSAAGPTVDPEPAAHESPRAEPPDMPEPGAEAEPPPDVTARAATLAALAAASVSAGETSGSTRVLVRNAIPAGSAPAPADAGTVYVGSRRTERLTMLVSTVLGTLGLLLAVAAAAIDQVKYDQPVACATYASAHKGSAAFGCTAAAKHIAVLLPAIGIPLLVLLSLIAVWVPDWLPRARFGLLGGLLVLLVLCAVAVALAYSGLPKSS